MLPINAEDKVYPAVQSGEFQIDQEGQIWRIAIRTGQKTGGTITRSCRPRRAERPWEDYLIVRTMIDWKRSHAMAHRLVWRHFVGVIPDGLTINHKDGKKRNNRLDNLELATYSEQMIHMKRVLGKLTREARRTIKPS